MFRSEPLLPGLRLPAFEVPERMHGDTHLLLWQIRGSTEVHLSARGGAVVLCAEELCAIPAGVTHRLRVSGESIVLPLWLPLSARAMAPAGHVWEVDGDLALLLLAVQQEQSGGVLSAGVDVEGALADRLCEPPTHPDALPPLPSSREAARVATAAMTGPELCAERLLSAGYSSRRTLERQFRAETGLGPVQWIRRVRLHQALGRLRRGASVQEAAAVAGYGDPGAFCRAFRLQYGVPPSRHPEIRSEAPASSEPPEVLGARPARAAVAP